MQTNSCQKSKLIRRGPKSNWLDFGMAWILIQNSSLLTLRIIGLIVNFSKLNIVVQYVHIHHKIR